MNSPREVFEQVIAKDVSDWPSVRATLDLAERIAGHFDALIDRYYLLQWRSPVIPSNLEQFYDTISKRMILYGLFTHFICFGSDNRSKFRKLDPEQFYNLWVEESVRGLSTLTAYSRDHQRWPDTVFAKLYSLEVKEPVYKSGVWWWKRWRIRGAVRDRFATGVMLGMVIDMASAKI